jgi:vesicle-associated membrane protein 7
MQIQGTNIKKSYQYEQYEFHILAENNYCFLIMADRGFKMRIAFASLDDIKNTFFAQFTPQ